SGLGRSLIVHRFDAGVPHIGRFSAVFEIKGTTFVAVLACLFAVFLLYRRITVIGRLSSLLWIGVLATIAWVIFAGVTHFNPSLAFSFPPGAFRLSHDFFMGLGSALLISIYDYWGYYNVCFLGGEVKDPGRNIPRAVVMSTVFVAIIYTVMNISILGVVPWNKMEENVISQLMRQVYGDWAGYLVAILVMWTAFASVFSLLLGYSRVPYAAALDGNYFKIFSRVHPKHRFPYVSLLVMGTVAAAFCFLKLADVIAGLVVIRILIQFLAQTAGVVVLRIRRPDMERPFRMWLYPLPAIVAFTGFVYILLERPNFQKAVRYAGLLLVIGLVVYFVRSWHRKEWPFDPGGRETVPEH
ncbi:MAG TPA: APC family permease, partial [Blastocatellia bacterium]|nr:APC family permease [Blastocatellia bacterium]